MTKRVGIRYISCVLIFFLLQCSLSFGGETSPPPEEQHSSLSSWTESDWWSFYYTTESMVAFGASEQAIYDYVTATMQQIGNYDPHYAPTPDIWPAPPGSGGPGGPGFEIEGAGNGSEAAASRRGHQTMTPQPPEPGCGAPYCPPISDVTPPRELGYAFRAGAIAAAAHGNTVTAAILELIALLIEIDNDEKESE